MPSTNKPSRLNSGRGIAAVPSFAEGGQVETPDQLMARMTAKYGAPSGQTVTQTASIQPAQPAPQAQQPKPAAQGGILAGAMNALAGRKKQLEEVAGYKNGGKIKGPGTATSDSIPGEVVETGAPIRVANGERILSKDQDAFIAGIAKKAGYESVDAFLEDGTGKPVGPTMKAGLPAAAGGAGEDELKNAGNMTYSDVQNRTAPAAVAQQVAQNIAPPANDPAAASPVTSGITGGVSLGRSPAPTIHENGGLPASVVQSGIEIMRGQLAQPVAQPKSAVAPPVNSGSWYSGTDSRDDRSGLEMERARRVEATQAGVMGDSVKSALQYGVIGKESVASPAATGGASASTQPTTQSLPGAVTPAATQTAANVNESTLAGRQGANMVENNLREFRDIGSGITAQRGANGQLAVTNIGTGGITDPTKTPQAANSYDGAGVNSIMARTNKINGELADMKQRTMDSGGLLGGNTGVHIMGDGGPTADEKANAEKTARWRQDELISKINSGQGGRAARTALGAALTAGIAGETQRDVATINAGSAKNNAAVQMRGQDLASRNEAARLAGNPVENQLKQAQTGGILAQNESQQMISDIQKKALSGDAQAVATYQALTGKKATPATDRYMTVQGGEEIGPDGMTKIKRPGGVFDAQAQRFVPLDGGPPAAKASKPTYDQFAAQMRQRHGDKATDAELQQAYSKQFGA